MIRVFISFSYHNHYARKTAHFLQNQMSTLDAAVSTIPESLDLGDKWQMCITDQINRCSVFICFVENDSPKVMFELGYALAKNKKIILVGDYKHLPADLRSMSYLPSDSDPFELLSRVEKILFSEWSITSSFELNVNCPSNTISELLDRPELLDSIEPREFGELIMQWFTAKGYQVDCPMDSRDCGYDFLIRPFKSDRAVVEVKKYKSTSQVPLNIIRQLVGSMALEHTSYGILVATAQFTKSAQFFVNDIKPTILLWTLQDLVQMDQLPMERIDEYSSY